jgi:hypothetical protein
MGKQRKPVEVAAEFIANQADRNDLFVKLVPNKGKTVFTFFTLL